MVKKTGGRYLNPVINLSITNNGTSRHHMPPGVTHWEGHKITYVIFLPKMYDLNLITRKGLDNKPKGRIILQMMGLQFSNVSRS